MSSATGCERDQHRPNMNSLQKIYSPTKTLKVPSRSCQNAKKVAKKSDHEWLEQKPKIVSNILADQKK